MIIYTTAKTDKDLEGILALQRANLATNLTPAEALSQGFVTVVHTLDILRKMNDIEPHVIAKNNDKVVAYLLAMTTDSSADIPILQSMFQTFDEIEYRGRPVSSYQYLVVGQVCIDKDFRGQGLLDRCYQTYRDVFEAKYEFAITEIATRNTRSMQAHKRIGFEEIYPYKAPDGEEWSIVIWNW